jgi:hypothetical protein
MSSLSKLCKEGSIQFIIGQYVCENCLLKNWGEPQFELKFNQAITLLNLTYLIKYFR